MTAAAMVIVCLLSAVAALCAGSGIASAGEGSRSGGKPRISYLEAARKALVEGDAGAAARALSAARKCWEEKNRECGFLRLDYQALVGVVYLEYGKHRECVETLTEVVRKEPHRRAAWLYLGRALYELGRYSEAASALRKAEKAGSSSPIYFVLRARAERKAKRYRDARATLERFAERFPRRAEPHRELVFLFGELGFFRTAATMARRYLIRSKGDLVAHLYLSDLLISASRHGSAARLLEEARMVAPRDAGVMERLGFAHARAGNHLTAARLFEKVCASRPGMAHASAEQYRLAGRFRDSLRVNRRIAEPKARLTQRLATMMKQGSYSRALHLHRALVRAGALTDRVAYQLAYAAVRAGRYDRAESLLREIASPPYRKKAARLTELVAACRGKPWLCL